MQPNVLSIGYTLNNIVDSWEFDCFNRCMDENYGVGNNGAENIC